MPRLASHPLSVRASALGFAGGAIALLVAWFAVPASAAVDDGKSIYTAKCSACHGASGKGDGPAARALPKPPRDFTDPAFWAGTNDDAVKTVIKNGLPGTIMRGFPMPEDQSAALVAYLRSFAAPAPPGP